MSEESKIKRVAARTSRDLYRQVKDFVAAQSNENDLELNGRVFGIEAFLNALLIDFFDRGDSERLEMLRRNVPRYEGHQKGDPWELGAAAPEIQPSAVIETAPKRRDHAPPKRRRSS